MVQIIYRWIAIENAKLSYVERFSTSQPFKSNFEYGMTDPAVFSSEKQSSRTDTCVCLY